MQKVALPHETANSDESTAPTTSTACCRTQADPFHRSAIAVHSVVTDPPTAVHALAETQDTPSRSSPPTVRGSIRRHDEPFHCSTSAAPPGPPTAMQIDAEVHETLFSTPWPSGFSDIGSALHPRTSPRQCAVATTCRTHELPQKSMV